MPADAIGIARLGGTRRRLRRRGRSLIAGPLIGAVPALLVATTVSTETAILTLVVYAVLQFVEGNILVPIVMRNAIGL